MCTQFWGSKTLGIALGQFCVVGKLATTQPEASLLGQDRVKTLSLFLGGGRESDLSVPVVEHRVVLAHKHVAEDPEGAHRLGHVHAHDGQDAHLAVPGVDHVLVPR